MEAYLKYRGLDKDYQVSGELDDFLTFDKIEKELTVDLDSKISECEAIRENNRDKEDGHSIDKNKTNIER